MNEGPEQRVVTRIPQETISASSSQVHFDAQPELATIDPIEPIQGMIGNIEHTASIPQSRSATVFTRGWNMLKRIFESSSIARSPEQTSREPTLKTERLDGPHVMGFILEENDITRGKGMVEDPSMQNITPIDMSKA